MKKGMKRIVSAILAAMTAATLAVTAFAADYAMPPVFNDTPSETVSVTTQEMKEAIAGVIADTADGAASEAEKTSVVTVNANSTKTLSVSASVLKALDKADTVLDIVAPKATITIDASTITKTRKVDLSMKTYSSEKRAVIKMRSKKNFGCEVKITLTDCKMSEAKLAKAHVYCDGEDLGPVELDENGKPVITITKGGTYEIK